MSYYSYSEYLKVIDELQEIIEINPFNTKIESYLKVILSIVSKKEGPSTLDALLNYN